MLSELISKLLGESPLKYRSEIDKVIILSTAEVKPEVFDDLAKENPSMSIREFYEHYDITTDDSSINYRHYHPATDWAVKKYKKRDPTTIKERATQRTVAWRQAYGNTMQEFLDQRVPPSIEQLVEKQIKKSEHELSVAYSSYDTEPLRIDKLLHKIRRAAQATWDSFVYGISLGLIQNIRPEDDEILYEIDGVYSQTRQKLREDKPIIAETILFKYLQHRLDNK